MLSAVGGYGVGRGDFEVMLRIFNRPHPEESRDSFGEGKLLQETRRHSSRSPALTRDLASASPVESWASALRPCRVTTDNRDWTHDDG
jgi:hypothetical protein